MGRRPAPEEGEERGRATARKRKLTLLGRNLDEENRLLSMIR